MKILTTQDNHINPKWIIESKEDIARICEVAKLENVDAICIAGDFFDKEIRSSNNDQWDEILQLARDLQAVAQVYFIYGTPSHDSPGCYSSFIDIGWKEVGIGKSHVVGDTLIMGLPEINTAFIHANFPDLNKQEGIEKQYDLVNQIIDDYYVPLSRSHKGSVHFMMHGHVSGTKFRDDQKPRTTDFMFSEEMLSRIGADFIQAGHIHLRQDFKTVFGGYGGSMHITWNDVNFKPGFDIVTHYSRNGKDAAPAPLVSRYDFDKLERQKIIVDDANISTMLIEDIRDNVNLWVEIKCSKDFADEFSCDLSLIELKKSVNIGPLSKITTTIQHEEHTRIDLEEYEKVSSLEDLALIYDPDFSKSIIKKINIAEEATAGETASIIPRTFEFLDMELIGSIINYENGVDRIFVDYSMFKLGANLFIGANGKGKSFINGLIHPFSEHLPDGSNLKDLFVAKNSSMVRRFRIVETNEIITQKVLIDPTLANPTAKFYMDINGRNIAAENGNVKPFDEKVTEIFGSIKMFMATVLKAQKENIKMPSLENSKEADLRQIFTELSGIDRSPIKNYAHDQVVNLKRSIELDEREIEVLGSIEESAESINNAIIDTGDLKRDKEISLSKNKSDLEDEKSELSKLDKIVNENQSVDSQLSALSSEAQNLTAENGGLQHELNNISVKLENIDATKLELEKLKKVQADSNEAATAYFEAQEAYNKKVDSWQKEKDREDEKLKKIKDEAEVIKNIIEGKDNINTGFKNEIEKMKTSVSFLNKPCEHCKKLSSTAEKEIQDFNDKIECFSVDILTNGKIIASSTTSLQNLRDEYKIIQDSIFPKPEPPENLEELKNKMDSLKPDTAKISELENILSGLSSSETRKTELETTIKQAESRINAITNQITDLKASLKPVNKIEYESLKLNISSIESTISDNIAEISRLEAQIEGLKDRLKKNREREEKIKDINQRLDIAKVDKSEWEIVETAFSPKGIPAMELSLIAPSINSKANEFLSLHSNRFNVDIVTQDLDSKNNIAEKFKILIHDSKAADVKNLPNCSPGQLSWLTSALKEAISYVRSKRSGRTYLWSIIDEGDGALDTEAMSDYYEMMDRAMDGKRKLISVSHSPIAAGLGLNTVNVEDFFMGGE
jgi:predicted  nucleic acid-binding Zn-ribbon protein/DNA repair exonuclease SbcCD nuclease subunit